MAADPVFVDCPEGAWTKVADGATVGQLHKVSDDPSNYLQTYRLAGEAAPTLIADGVPAFPDNGRSDPISSDAAIDVYIWPQTAAGRVRVDL